MSLPLPVSKYLQASRVDDQMERTVVTPGKARDLDISITPGERGVVGSLEGKAHQADQRSDEAFGLPECEVEDRPQGQGGHDRQVRIPALSPWPAAE